MKNTIKILVISLTFGLIIGISAVSIAQPGGAPPPPSGHGSEGDQAPGGLAPIGSGLVILIAMGATYGAKKIFDARKKIEE